MTERLPMFDVENVLGLSNFTKEQKKNIGENALKFIERTPGGVIRLIAEDVIKVLEQQNERT